MKNWIVFLCCLLMFTGIFAQDSSAVAKPAADTTGNITVTDSVAPKKIAPWYVERFGIAAGFFLPVNDISIRVGIKGGVDGTNIDFQKDLGFPAVATTFLAGFQWRISPRSRVDFTLYKVDRSSDHTLQKDIVFDGNTYPVNASIHTFFNTSIYQISYGYAILSKPKYELGLMIGAHIVGGKVGMSVNGANVGNSMAKDFGFTAPLPDLGIWGGYAFTPRLAVNLTFDYLALTVNQIKGQLIAYNILFLYKIADPLVVSLGYSGLNFNVDVDREHATGSFKWGYNGPALALTYTFGKKSWTH